MLKNTIACGVFGWEIEKMTCNGEKIYERGGVQ